MAVVKAVKKPPEPQGQEEELQASLLTAQGVEQREPPLPPSPGAPEVQHIAVPFCGASEYRVVAPSAEVAGTLYR